MSLDNRFSFGQFSGYLSLLNHTQGDPVLMLPVGFKPSSLAYITVFLFG